MLGLFIATELIANHGTSKLPNGVEEFHHHAKVCMDKPLGIKSQECPPLLPKNKMNIIHKNLMFAP